MPRNEPPDRGPWNGRDVTVSSSPTATTLEKVLDELERSKLSRKRAREDLQEIR